MPGVADNGMLKPPSYICDERRRPLWPETE
jgi:hypothetical protein